jgi:uroporphyrinogen III methyltransferase / synthase
MAHNTPLVSLVGAGPGDPGLLTLRAVECLRQADLVVYDYLVPTRLLDHANPQAERICLDQLAPDHAERYRNVAPLLIEAARRGRHVVRLKGGDPLVFGRGGEEASALRQAGIPFEIVPGVTAALGAAACAGIPLTHRTVASAVAFVTGHEQPGKESSLLDWSALARFPGTLVFYMPIARLAQIVAMLVQEGKDPSTPAAAVRWAATPEQQTLVSTLAQLPGEVQHAQMQAPCLVLVGPVVALRSELAWFEDRPLFDKCVLVTRPSHQAGAMVERLERLGATCIVQPVVEIREPADWSPVDHALANLRHYDWLIFTSVNGVHAFLSRLRHLGDDLRALGHLHLAAIGPSTAAALRTYHLDPDVVPEEFSSEGLFAALKERVAGKRVLLARADRGRELLNAELAAIAQVEQVAVYSQADVMEMAEKLRLLLTAGKIDFITLTSSNIARGLLRHLDTPARQQIDSGRIKLVSISPVTSTAIREFGFPVAAEATTFTTEGVVQALLGMIGK